MADRLISVPAAKHFVQTVIADPILQATINNILDGLVAVDAVPVVHGRWEPHPNHFGFDRCSICHDCIIANDWPDGVKWKYCPNCGAKMDLEVADNG
jgi:hypothetical protein